uniref:Uncharacterized protein n=1 Tax=Ditylenchus dipsaci TaxID=166011 RepID=A0A915E7Y8_9BILA
MNYEEPILSFDSWQEMKQTLLQHQNGTEISQLTIEEMQLDDKAMDFLRSASSNSWSGDCMVDFKKVDFSGAGDQQLDELFNDILTPRYFQFVGLQGMDGFCQALDHLKRLSHAETVKVFSDPTSDPIGLDFHVITHSFTQDLRMSRAEQEYLSVIWLAFLSDCIRS